MEIFTFRENTKEREFKQLFETYYAPFCLYAKRYIKEDQLRKDLVSDVFAPQVWLSPGRYLISGAFCDSGKGAYTGFGKWTTTVP